jgi:hypothetical protein
MNRLSCRYRPLKLRFAIEQVGFDIRWCPALSRRNGPGMGLQIGEEGLNRTQRLSSVKPLGGGWPAGSSPRI